MAPAEARSKAQLRRQLAELQRQLAEERAGRTGPSQSTLERERLFARMGDQILALKELRELLGYLQREWVDELRRVGIPLYEASFQIQGSTPGHFALLWATRPAARHPSGLEVPLSRYPWVGEAWQTGEPVRVDRERLAQHGFPVTRVQALIEVPLPTGGGSMGFSSTDADAFGPGNVELLRRFAGLLATALRRLQDIEALRESQARLDSVLRAVPDIIYRLDANGHVSFINEAVRRYGYTPEDFIGHDLLDFVHPDDRPGATHPLKERRTGTRRTAAFEVRLLCRRGDPRAFEMRIDEVVGSVPLLVDAEGLYTADGPSTHVFYGTQGVARDITERLRLERQVQEQRLRSLQVDRLQALGEMAAGVAHELNQPLNGIRAFAEGTVYGLDRGWATNSSEVRDTMREIVALVDRMAGIIDHMRSFARDSSLSSPMPFALTEVVDGALKLVGAQLRLHGIEVVVDTAAQAPQVVGRANRLEQALLNLVTNARDALESRRLAEHLPSGWHPTLRLALTADAASGPVQLAVIDNAGGVPEAVVGRVFDPFFTTKEVGRGTGLGLSIARGIMQEHGGGLELQNRPGEGATFVMSLPAAPTDGAITPEGTRPR
jgi:PAS domain S-box-containing protein